MYLPTYVQNLYKSKIIFKSSPKSDFSQVKITFHLHDKKSIASSPATVRAALFKVLLWKNAQMSPGSNIWLIKH